MNTMRCSALHLALLLTAIAASVRGIELGKAEGSLTINGAAVPLRFAYGRTEPHPYDPRQKTLILLTSHPLPKDALEFRNVLSQMRKDREVVTVEIWLDDKRQPVRTAIYKQTDFPMSFMKTEMRAAVSSPDVIEASVKLDKDAFGDLFALDVTFRAAIGPGETFAENPAASQALSKGDRFPAPSGIPATKPKSVPAPVAEVEQPPQQTPAPSSLPNGTPLPKGGGEPGKVYLAWSPLFRKGDLAGAQALMTQKMIKDTGVAAAAVARPAALFLGFERGFQPIHVEVLGGSVAADKAILDLKGDLFGHNSNGKATLIKEGDAWKVESDEWGLPMSEQSPLTSSVPALTDGTPLPNDGGEPGRVWREYDAAVRSRDVAALEATLTTDSLQRFEQYQLGDFIDFLSIARAPDTHIVSGMISGDKAVLRLEETPQDPAQSGHGRANLIRENGSWKLIFPDDWTAEKKQD